MKIVFKEFLLGRVLAVGGKSFKSLEKYLPLDVVKEERSRERQSPDPAELDFNSQLDVSIVFSARETMLNV